MVDIISDICTLNGLKSSQTERFFFFHVNEKLNRKMLLFENSANI